MISPPRRARRAASPALLLVLNCVLGGALGGALTGCASDPGTQIDPAAQLEVFRATALSLYEQEDLPSAELQAVKGLGIDPEDYQLQLLYAWINLRKGTTSDLKRAEGVFRELLTTMPEEGDFRVELGLAECLERLGVVYAEAAKAIESGERYTEQDPATVTAQLIGDGAASWVESEQLYLSVLASRPGSLKALNGLQRVTALQGRAEDSLAWSAKLLKITREEVRLREQQLQFGDLDRSQENRLRDQQRLTRELEVATLIYAADVNMGMGNDARALAHLEEALSRETDKPEVYARKAQVLFRLRKYEAASIAINDYLRTSALPYEHPDVRRAYDLLAECESAARTAGS